MNIDIIAKGVETEEQKKILAENGCMNIQGYIYAKPMVSHKMEEILNHQLQNSNINEMIDPNHSSFF